MSWWNRIFKVTGHPTISLNQGDKVYFKNDAGNLRVTKTLNAHDRREVKRDFVRRNWDLMTQAVREHKSDTRLRMSYPRNSKRKEAVNGLRMVLQYAPSSVDFDIFNALKNLFKEESDKLTVTTRSGQWRPKNMKR